jgi:PAS domain S-box-containing protein
MLRLNENNAGLHSLTQKYETIVSNIREVIFQLDTNGKILEVNTPWEDLSGYTIKESVGKNIFSFILKGELHGASSSICTKTAKRECYIYAKNKKIKLVELSLKPLLTCDGCIYGYACCIFDRTEQKEQEAQTTNIKRVNHLLEEKLHDELYKNIQKEQILIQQSRLVSMGEMIASLGHQWRQQLNNLSFYVHDVREALDYDEIDYQYIDRLTRESMAQIEHMSNTINDLRKFYKTNKEKVEFSIAESIEDALSIFESSLKKHEIQVNFEYRGQQTAFGFPNEFRQIVLYILTNSKEAFVHNAIEKRKIVIKIVEMEGLWMVSFADNAGGITHQTLQRIFDATFTTKAHGTGLGLYLTKLMIDNMKGSINVENTIDGTLISVYVPRVKIEPCLASTVNI